MLEDLVYHLVRLVRPDMLCDHQRGFSWSLILGCSAHVAACKVRGVDEVWLYQMK